MAIFPAKPEAAGRPDRPGERWSATSISSDSMPPASLDAHVGAASLSSRILPAALIALVIALPRLLTLSHSVMLDGDEYSFAMSARDLLQGVMPSEGDFEHKPIALYEAFALAQIVFGEGLLAIRMLALLTTLATAALLGRCARLLTPAGISPAYSLVVPLSYGALAFAGPGAASYSELLVALGLAAEFSVALRYLTAPRMPPLAAMGLGGIAGVTLMINYLALLPICSGIVAMFVAYSMATGSPRSAASRMLRILVLAIPVAAAVCALLLLPLVTHGKVAQYFDFQRRFITVYHGAWLSSPGRILIGLAVAGPTLAFIFTLVVAAGFSSRRVESGAGSHWQWAFLFVNLLGAFFAAIASGRYYAHYFILLLPATVLLAYVSVLWNARCLGNGMTLMLLLPMLAFSTSCKDAIDAWHQHKITDGGIIRSPGHDVVARMAADIRPLLGPEDYLYCYTSERYAIALYYLSHARTPNLLYSPLHHLDRAITRAFDTTPEREIASILARHPKFIVRGAGAEAPRGQDSEGTSSTDALIDSELSREYQLVRQYSLNPQDDHEVLTLFERRIPAI